LHGIDQFVLFIHFHRTVASYIGVNGSELVLEQLVLCCQEDCFLLVYDFEFGLDGIMQKNAACVTVEVRIRVTYLFRNPEKLDSLIDSAHQQTFN
jgi:hypothetical protein